MSKKIDEKRIRMTKSNLLNLGKKSEVDFLRFILFKQILGNYVLEELLNDLTKSKFTLEELLKAYDKVRGDSTQFSIFNKDFEYKEINEIMNYLWILYREGATVEQIQIKFILNALNVVFFKLKTWHRSNFV